MILFFDRNVGTHIPRALQLLRPRGVGIEFHQQHFRMDEPDDVWLPEVGRQGWIVVGHDYKYHRMPNELAAIRLYSVACFYLWGADAPKWDSLRVFARAYDRILRHAEHTPRPFVCRIQKTSRLSPVRLAPDLSRLQP